jgi:aryl-alcohol dehydrogenase-like predicted oxidoreductase
VSWGHAFMCGRVGWEEFQVSALGSGCMGLSTWYGKPLEENGATALIHHAFNNGVTFFDTSDAYGPHTNERLIGKVLVQTWPLLFYRKDFRSES